MLRIAIICSKLVTKFANQDRKIMHMIILNLVSFSSVWNEDTLYAEDGTYRLRNF